MQLHKLLEPDSSLIQPREHPPIHVCAPEAIAAGTSQWLRDYLLRDYEYQAVEACAGDGLCEIACPLGINTGVLMKHFRHQEHTHSQEYVARQLAENRCEVEERPLQIS